MNLELDGLTFPLRLRPDTPLTDPKLEALSRRNKPYRIERNKQGELIVITPIGTLGGSQEIYVGMQLAHWSEESGLGITFGPNTGFNLPDGSCLAPDGAWLPLPRWSALTLEQQKGFAPLCPEFLLEIRSPNDSRKILEDKMLTWIENGARLAWLIDPIEATVTVYRPGSPTETLERPDVVPGHEPVAGFQLKTTRLWPKL